ncbi:HAD family hydrolase [Flavobacterium sp. K77]|uniref:HAD family hydrolase n=1 Tax=Flavobacterium sp. K77 TaxID=2910676 RepID=UPI001F2F14AA|nr:HAD family hydrolase [Flavobacterium sp. K77]MCF6142070.1 HAD family hydrolase [Flavobacterium sp. K77]
MTKNIVIIENKNMNISFDLDSTLIPNGKEFETEKISGIAELFGVEQIRKGTRELISDLQKEGNKIHIYTTSFRTKRKIRFTLWYYGIKVNRIVTQEENQRILKSRKINSSKYPTAFDFDIHIDDSRGVGIEAEKFNFKAIIIEPSEINWVEKIKSQIKNVG